MRCLNSDAALDQQIELAASVVLENENENAAELAELCLLRHELAVEYKNADITDEQREEYLDISSRILDLAEDLFEDESVPQEVQDLAYISVRLELHLESDGRMPTVWWRDEPLNEAQAHSPAWAWVMDGEEFQDDLEDVMVTESVSPVSELRQLAGIEPRQFSGRTSYERDRLMITED